MRNYTRLMRVLPLVLTAIGLCPSMLVAQAPAVGHMYPPGAPAGTTVEVQLGGYDFTPDIEYFLHEPRATLKVTGAIGRYLVTPPPYWFGPKGRTTAFAIPREQTATITLPANLPRGPIHWQVANANGASSTAVFFVGDGPEVMETRLQAESQRIASLPMTVNGRLSRITEVDRYTVTATHDGCLTADLYARRLGSDFNGTLKVADASGKMIGEAVDTQGVDCAVTVSVKKGESYTVEVADLDHRGHRGYVYRLELTPGPRIVTMMPSGGRAGATIPVTFVGVGLKTGQSRLETATAQVTFPAESAKRGWYSYRLETPHGRTPLMAMPVSPLPEIIEPAPGAARNLALNSIITGRLAKVGEVDEYNMTANKGQHIRIEAVAADIGSHLDPVLRVFGADDKQLVINDDFGGSLDAGLDFVPPADGTYRIRVQKGTGDDGRLDSVYRLTVTESQPGFTLSIPQTLVVPVGGKAPLTVTAVRQAGFDAEIVITMEGLPEGVAPPKEIKIAKGKPSVKFSLEVAKTSGTEAAFVSVTGTAMKDGKPLVVNARSTFAGSLVPRKATTRHDNRLLLVRQLPSPVTLELVDLNRQRPVHQGTTYPADFVVKRDEGFQGPIRVRMAAKQQRRVQGMQGPELEVPDGATTVLYPCFMPEWLETDRTTRMLIHSVAIVTDAKGKKRHVVKPSKGNITMILEGALLKVAQQSQELTVTPGGSFEVPIVVSRSAKLQETTIVKIEPPEAVAGLLRCQPLVLKPGTDRGMLKVMSLPDAKLSGDWKIKIVATALQDGRWPAVSITHVPVRFSAGAR
mgnify:CR=1 FL=1